MADGLKRKSSEKETLSRSASIVVYALLATFFLESFSASLQKSPTYDEVIHTAAGLSYVSTGHIVINQQHPPLLKELAGLFLFAAGVRWPSDPQARELAAGTISIKGPLPERLMADIGVGYPVANALMANSGVGRVLFWARLPLILLSTAFGYVLFLFARTLAGTAAGLGALFLFTFDPVILAHSFLVTTDVGSAGFILLALFAFWKYLERPSPPLVIACGCAFGAALCAKFSAVVLLPIVGLLFLSAVVWPPFPHSTSNAALAALPPANVARRSGDRRRQKGRHKRENRAAAVPSGPRTLLRRYTLAVAGMAVVAFAVVEIIYLFPSDPFQYIAGMRLVNADHLAGFLYYMKGALAPRFYSYYVVAYLLKEPLPAIVLAGIGLTLVCWRQRFSPAARTLMLLPPLALLGGYTILSDNVGVRYIIPVLFFAHLWGGIALSSLIGSASLLSRAGAAVLCICLMAAAAGIYPDHLSYFNEAACLLDQPSQIGLDGGTRCGPAWLDDSNVDWGQGLKQLKTWLDRNAPGRTIHLAYLGKFPPEGYGIHYEPMADDDFKSPKPGLYGVSASFVARIPAMARQLGVSGPEWLKQTKPSAIVGHAYYIFDVPAKSPSSPAQENH